ncbi:hypothetical protein [Candidatus Poriferisodalis sp.]|uniref:hypothetical protein n=1 Tax=Candidatus Poriferisodalis sp. TaxID=3101277 RepID=UPI003B0150B3
MGFEDEPPLRADCGARVRCRCLQRHRIGFAPVTTVADAVTTTTAQAAAPATTASAVAAIKAPATTHAPASTMTEAPRAEPAAGDLVSDGPVDAGDLDGWRITYLSTGVGGDPVEVSGLVFAPP